MNLKSFIRKASTRVYIRLAQKKYKRITYLLQKGETDTLVISFSGFPGNGPAKYNYMKTLQKLKAHKLFVLDNFGYQKQGSYYLGEQGDFFYQLRSLSLWNRFGKRRTSNTS